MPVPWVIKASRDHRRRVGLYAGAAAASAPTFSRADAGDIGTTTIEVTFTQNVTATNYVSGVTIKLNAVSKTINSGTRQANKAIVHYVIDTAADVNDTLTWEYAEASGDYENDDGIPMPDQAASSVNNWIGSHTYFDTADDAVWLAAA